MSDDQATEDFVDAINFAIDESDGSAVEFLRCWREGNWEALELEWPEFEISDALKNPHEYMAAQPGPTTDLQKLTALLDEFGIGHKTKERHCVNGVPEPGTQIKCKQGYDKVDGYNWFYTTFDFDAEGKFIKMGVWE